MSGGRDQHEGFFARLRDLTRRRDSHKRGLFARLRNRLLVGFLVAFPLVVTIFFARIVFEFLDRWFRPISVRYLGFPLVGAGMLLSLIALYLLGVVATNVFGGRLLDLFERKITRLPLLSPIYQGARQITEAIQIREVRDFRQVVLLAFPHPGVRSIGFVTREFPQATSFCDEGSVLVFVPTTPNPTSGFLVAVPKREVTPLAISVEAGVKLVISGGLLTPEVLLEDPSAPPRSDSERALLEAGPGDDDKGE
jgi:uncharacterized membrane protein